MPVGLRVRPECWRERERECVCDCEGELGWNSSRVGRSRWSRWGDGDGRGGKGISASNPRKTDRKDIGLLCGATEKQEKNKGEGREEKSHYQPHGCSTMEHEANRTL